MAAHATRASPRLISTIVLAGLCAIPVGFCVWAWVQANGFPYFKDANESFLSFVQARALTRFPPSQTFFLSFEDTRYDHTTPYNPYTHNPNLPRYVHGLLLAVGITSFSVQILLISTVVALASTAAVWRLATSLTRGDVALAVALPLVFVLDTMGVLTWTVNTYRVFSFLLIWGGLASVVRPAPAWVLVLVSFLILQFEYGFALFALPAIALFGVMLHGRAAWKTLTWLAVGGAASVAVFATQVLLFYGPAGAWAEIQATIERRGPAGTTGTAEAGALPDLLVATASAIASAYRQPIPWLVAWSVLTAPVVVWAAWRWRAERRLRPDWSFRVALASMQLGLVAGCLASALVLRSYFNVAFVESFAPCLVFVVVVGLATVGLDLSIGLRVLFGRLGRPQPAVAHTIGGVAAAALMLLNAGHVFVLSPPLDGTFVPLLQTRYAGLPFVAPDSYHNLAFALTWGSAAPSPRIVTATDLQAYADLRTSSGDLYYLCVMRPVVDTFCYQAAGRMMSDGHELREWGTDFVILRLAAEATPLAGPEPPIPDWLDQRTQMPPVFDATRWATDGATGRAVSRNASLQWQDGAVRGWDVLDRGGVSVERGRAPGDRADAGGWLELRARVPGARLGLRTTVDAGSTRGAPLLARVSARGFGTGLLAARLRPVGAPDAGHPVSRADLTSAWARPSGSWQTLLLRLEPEQTNGREVELTIELVDARPEDRLDVRQAEVVAASPR